jgi:hypothetical protein
MVREKQLLDETKTAITTPMLQIMSSQTGGLDAQVSVSVSAWIVCGVCICPYGAGRVGRVGVYGG